MGSQHKSEESTLSAPCAYVSNPTPRKLYEAIKRPETHVLHFPFNNTPSQKSK